MQRLTIFFGSKDDTPPDEAADRLYNEGLYLLNVKNDPKKAAKKFEEVDRQHPYSEWARKSLIMSSYAYYQAGDYDDCVTAAQRYITLHPGSPDAAYAQYLIGASYFDEIPDITRDQARTEKALAALQEVIRKYPTSEYAVAPSRRSRSPTTSSPARKCRSGAITWKSKDYTGAINRFKVVVTKYQTTRHVEEALMRLTEAYMALGIVDEAQTAAAVLGHNFPDSVWYKHAYTLVKTGGGEPSRTRAPGSARLSARSGWASRITDSQRPGRPSMELVPAVVVFNDGIEPIGFAAGPCSPDFPSATSS